MIIKNFSIRHRHDKEKKTYTFDKLVNLFHSNKNATGKTTFLRSLLYTLGFPVPNTKLINFSNYEFEMNIEYENGIVKTVKRFDTIVSVDDVVYSCPNDFSEIISEIFLLNNQELISNILGTIYIDQEKGWTLLNRGKIIGDIGFNIESFLRGLNDNDVSDLKKKLNDLSDESKRYQLLLDVSKYKNEINEMQNPISISDYNENANKEILMIDNKLEIIQRNINEMQKAKNNNTKFANYIDSMGLRVLIDGKEHVIVKDELVGFKEYSNLATIQINELSFEKNKLIKRRKELAESIKNEPLFDVKTALQHFEASISKSDFKISEIQILRILNELQKSRNEINEKIKAKTLDKNIYIQKINKHLEKYWHDFNIEIPYSGNYLFTHDLKSLSGGILYKMILAYKFSYISVLQEKCGYKLPIFIDSPNGREVTEETITSALRILVRDFSDNQIFICSIFKFESVLSLKSSNVLSFDVNKPFDRCDSLSLLK